MSIKNGQSLSHGSPPKATTMALRKRTSIMPHANPGAGSKLPPLITVFLIFLPVYEDGVCRVTTGHSLDWEAEFHKKGEKEEWK